MLNTIDELLASGALRIEPHAQNHLRGQQELSLLRVELAPGVQEPAHTHPGLELLYGLAGHGFVDIDRSERQRLSPGDTVQVPRGTVKSLGNDGATPFVVLAVLVLDTGQPSLTPA